MAMAIGGCGVESESGAPEGTSTSASGEDATEVDGDTDARVEESRDSAAVVEAGRAEAMVRDFFDAVASRDWERAAGHFGSSGSHPLEFGADIAGTPYENTELGSLIRREPELSDARDLAGLLRAWCERHDGLCSPVDRVTDVAQLDARPTHLVSVRLRDSDGNVVEVENGSSVFALTVGWYEGERYLTDLPATT